MQPKYMQPKYVQKESVAIIVILKIFIANKIKTVLNIYKFRYIQL